MAHGMDVSSLNTFNSTAALFGAYSNNQNSSSNGWMSNVSDLKMIQNGVYKRTLQSVYDKQGKEATKESVKKAISEENPWEKTDEEKEKELFDLHNESTFQALF